MNKQRRVLELRAELKSLIEQRADIQNQMEEIINGAKTETRALNDEEVTKFDELEKQREAIDKTIDRENRARKEQPKKDTTKTIEQIEIRAFADFVRKEAGLPVEQRAGEQNITMGNNGAIVPTTIANMIIKAVKDICPIYAKATIYHVKGILKVPVWGKANTTHDIAVGYQSEFTDITADSGKFSSVDLSGYLAGALTLIGKSVINNGDVDVVNFIVSQMAEEIAAFIEKELLTGSGSSAATGVLSTTNTLITAAATAITADELIDLQAKIKQVYQPNACWIMNPATFTTIKKLKDANNRYLLQDDYTSDFPYRLLGKPVYLSDNMPIVSASAKAVLYGDLSGLSVNMREDVQIQILLEKYATQHAVGVVSWFEFDSKVTDNQKLAVLVQKSA